jgi:hypothetical protein
MSLQLTNMALYNILVKELGVSPTEAEKASSVDVSSLATKQDLELAVTRLENSIKSSQVEIMKWMLVTTVGTMIGLAGLVYSIAKSFAR